MNHFDFVHILAPALIASVGYAVIRNPSPFSHRVRPSSPEDTQVNWCLKVDGDSIERSRLASNFCTTIRPKGKQVLRSKPWCVSNHKRKRTLALSNLFAPGVQVRELLDWAAD